MTRAELTPEEELEELARKRWGLVIGLAVGFVAVIAFVGWLIYEIVNGVPSF